MAASADKGKLAGVSHSQMRHPVFSVFSPAPKVFVENFGDSGINLTLTAWTKSDNFLDFKNQLFIAVKETLDQNNIKIPYKKLDLVR